MRFQFKNERWDRLAQPKEIVKPDSTKKQSKPKIIDIRLSDRLNTLAQPKSVTNRVVLNPKSYSTIKKAQLKAKTTIIVNDCGKKGILKNAGESSYIKKVASTTRQRRQIWLDLMAKPKCINIDSNPDYERIVHRRPNKERIEQLAMPKNNRRRIVSPSFSI